jgi:FMN reductase
MTTRVLLLAGSPQVPSRSSGVLAGVAERLAAKGVASHSYALGDFEPAELVHARVEAPAVQRFVEAARAAAALVVATPVYKGTYSGGLKLLLDLIPPDALRGKPALAIATARVAQYFPSVQRAFDDLFLFFQTGVALAPVFLVDEQARLDGDQVLFDAAALAALDRAANTLSAALGAG